MLYTVKCVYVCLRVHKDGCESGARVCDSCPHNGTAEVVILHAIPQVHSKLCCLGDSTLEGSNVISGYFNLWLNKQELSY